METEGIALHESYWANDPVLKAYLDKMPK